MSGLPRRRSLYYLSEQSAGGERIISRRCGKDIIIEDREMIDVEEEFVTPDCPTGDPARISCPSDGRGKVVSVNNDVRYMQEIFLRYAAEDPARYVGGNIDVGDRTVV